eukprot:12967446-Ditylum_brightwellii.AAC.1
MDENVDVTNLNQSGSIKQAMESPGSTVNNLAQHAEQKTHAVEHIVVSFLMPDNSDDLKRDWLDMVKDANLDFETFLIECEEKYQGNET